MKRFTALLLCVLMLIVACVSLTGCKVKYENLDGQWLATARNELSPENINVNIDSENLLVSVGSKSFAFNKVKTQKNEYIKDYSKIIFTTENKFFVDKTPSEKFTFEPFGETVMWCKSIPFSYKEKDRPCLVRKCVDTADANSEPELVWTLDGLVQADNTITINADALIGAYSYKYLKLSNGETTDGMLEFTKDGDKLTLTDNGTVCEITEISYSAKFGHAVKIDCKANGNKAEMYILEYSENYLSVVYTALNGAYTDIGYNYLVKEK